VLLKRINEIKLPAVLLLLLILMMSHPAANSALAASSQEKGIFQDLGLGVNLWLPTLRGTARVNGNSSGTIIDFKDTLGISDKNMLSVFPFTSTQGKLRLSYSGFSYNGNKRSVENINYNSVVYPAGGNLISDLDVKTLRLLWLSDFSLLGDSNFSWILGVQGYDLKLALDAATVPNNRSERAISGVMPSLGARFETARTKPTAYYAEIYGFPAKEYAFNAEIGAAHRLPGKAVLSLGYKISSQKAKSGGDYIKVELSGPFAQLKYKF